jgi:rubredoxin-NAD+ reductase
MNRQPVAIIGSGLAGYTAAREFRKLDAEAPLVILSADHGGFYSKPMLSNAFAQRKDADMLLGKNAAQMAAELRAEVVAHAEVTGIDPEGRTIAVKGGTLPYGKLVLALGADPISLPLQGDGADRVLSVNDLEDYRRFRASVEGRREVAILGAGLIGCEFADDLAGAGYKVHVIDPSPQPLGRLLPPAAGEYMQRRLEGLGIVFHPGTTARAIVLAGERFRLSLADGGTIEADAVLSAVGLRPRTALAQAAGIEVNRGILVDGFLRASHGDIHALGDCAEVEGRVLPFVMPIMHAARALAATLAGRPTPVRYPAMPVVVKTPSCPAVVSPPEPGAAGAWRVQEVDGGIRALFEDEQGQLLGFSLLGSAVAEKNALAQQLLPTSA